MFIVGVKGMVTFYFRITPCQTRSNAPIMHSAVPNTGVNAIFAITLGNIENRHRRVVIFAGEVNGKSGRKPPAPFLPPSCLNTTTNIAIVFISRRSAVKVCTNEPVLFGIMQINQVPTDKMIVAV